MNISNYFDQIFNTILYKESVQNTAFKWWSKRSEKTETGVFAAVLTDLSKAFYYTLGFTNSKVKCFRFL